MGARLCASFVCVAAASMACAGLRKDLDRATVSPEELLAGTVLGLPGRSIAPVEREDVLAMAPEMRAFVSAHVDLKSADNLKLNQLVHAIMGTDTFGVTYDETTRTAAETFRARRGNCLSFSNLFVAMAREVGLNVQFQEVDVPPDWTLDKDTFVLNRHVNVFVDLGPSGTRVVDFNIGDFKSSYEMRRISDSRALGHFYNNIGVARMQTGDTASAFACFRKAITDGDRGFTPAWTNLGTLYLRSGHPAHAEAAYLEALKTSEWDLVAMSNLSRLYEQMGDAARAEAYRKRVVHHRWRNPYYRYELAREAFAARDFDSAATHLKYAIRRKPKEDRFCRLLGLTYQEEGNARAARRWLARAEELAAAEAGRRGSFGEIDTSSSPTIENRH